MNLFTLVWVMFFIFLNGCYTVVEHTDTKPKKKFIYPGAIIEGYVEYFTPIINHRPIGSRKNNSNTQQEVTGGFKLRSYNWLVDQPNEFYYEVLLSGNIDHSYNRKWGQIKGHYEIRKTTKPRTGYSVNNLYLTVEKIYVIE
jgi:hypothetical protein